jgi:hypothetical protein
LLHNLFVESNILTKKCAFRKNDFLCEAAFAIVSSLSANDCAYSDIGTQLAVRLLVPYAIEQKNSRIISTIANILERYYPSSDHCADTLILCLVPLLDLKSYQILECSSSIRLCSYRRHKRDLNHFGAVYSIMRGIETESKYLPRPELGQCCKLLTGECRQASLVLLNSLVEADTQDHTQLLLLAREFVCGFKSNRLDSMTFYDVTQLERVLYIFENLNSENDGREVGHNIVACLQSTVDNDGVYDSQRCLSWNLPLLHLACTLIDRFADRSAFGVKEINEMMKSLSNLSASIFEMQNISYLGRILSKGLSYAIISESQINGKEKISRDTLLNQCNISSSRLRSANIDEFSAGIQEQTIRKMLDF